MVWRRGDGGHRGADRAGRHPVYRWLLFGIPILAPRQDGAWGDASTAEYAIAAAAAALVATAIMQLPMRSPIRYSESRHLDSATLVLCRNAGHALLFQYAKAFAAEVTNFLAA